MHHERLLDVRHIAGGLLLENPTPLSREKRPACRRRPKLPLVTRSSETLFEYFLFRVGEVSVERKVLWRCSKKYGGQRERNVQINLSTPIMDDLRSGYQGYYPLTSLIPDNQADVGLEFLEIRMTMGARSYV